MLALGEIGLSYDEFYSLTPRSFNNLTVGWSRKQEREKKESWEQIRMLFFGVLKPHLKRKDLTAEKLLPFPWDEKSEEIDLEDVDLSNSEEVAQKQMDFWAKIDSKKRVSNGKFSAN